MKCCNNELKFVEAGGIQYKIHVRNVKQSFIKKLTLMWFIKGNLTKISFAAHAEVV